MDIRITPSTGTIAVTGSAVFIGSGSTANTSILAVDGNNGRLFEVSDDLSDSLFSVNTIAGLPVIEAFADNTVVLGEFNQNNLIVSGSKVGINTSTLTSTLTVNGSIAACSFVGVSSLTGTTSDTLTALGIGAATNTSGIGNTALGRCALLNNTTGQQNTAVGYGALQCQTYQTNNTAVGCGALSNNTGNSNDAFGLGALRYNGSVFNAAFGGNALASNTTGARNTAMGNQALFYNTTGARNTAVGMSALRYNTTGYCNVAVGYKALCNNRQRNNTAIGANAGCSNYGGYRNIFVGTGSGGNVIGGQSNVFVGYSSGTGTPCYTSRNVAIGAFAKTGGDCNVSIGFEAGRYSANFGGSTLRNTAVGYRALRGSYSTCCFSASRLTAIGACALACKTTGNYSTAIGDGALRSETSGCCNTAVGYRSSNQITTARNTIHVGHESSPSNTSNHTLWGNSSNNVCNCIYTEWSNVSDCRDKTDIQALPDNLGLNLIKKLRPVSFKWDHRDTYVRECKYEYGQKDGTLKSEKEHYGLVAQELKQTLDELDAKFDGLGHDVEKDAYRLTYAELIAPLIKAVQELEARITSLENNS